MLALTGIAAVPLLGLASTNVQLQRNVTDMHVFMGHYGFMAALAYTIIGVAILASLRPVGWRLTAAVAALLAAVLGGTSLLYPDAASSLDTGWALAAIAWATAFAGLAVRTDDAQRPTSMPVAPLDPAPMAHAG
jgi:hypothetical protein